MQLASTALVVQSFGYGPRHSVHGNDAAESGSEHLNDIVYGVPNQVIVQGGLIHFRAMAGSAAVTFCNAFDDWHHQKLAMVITPGTLVAFVSSTPR